MVRSASPTISIVTACYNSRAFIGRLYRSLAAQRYRQFEWICVDDVSQDDTVQHLIKLSPPGDLGMKVYQLPANSGGPLALAVGFQRAECDITIWLDHDDELLPHALETIAANWSKVEADDRLSGLALQAVWANGSPIGRTLHANLIFTASEGMNRFPEISDGTIAYRTELLKRIGTPRFMEEVALNGVLNLAVTKDRPLQAIADPPIRYYHRDNRQSQTNLERISRKTVASYARTLDAADRHYLRRPIYWFRYAAVMLRYSKFVHGRWFESLGYIKRPAVKLFAILAWPFAWTSAQRQRDVRIAEYAQPDFDALQVLGDLRPTNIRDHF